MVIRNANYPDRFGPTAKHFRAVIVLRLFRFLNFFPQLSNTYKELYIKVFFVRKKKKKLA